MMQSPEEVVRDYRLASDAMRKEYNTPEKARELLVEVGILEKDPASKNGVRLAKPYRD